jgi:hypothetical protein
MKFKHIVWTGLLLLACGSTGKQQTEVATTFPIKLGTFDGTRLTGVKDIFIHSPWQPDTYAQLTFPEHCWGVDLPNTSHDADPAAASPWQFNADSSAAWYERNPREGVTFRATAEADSMAVRLRIVIGNQTELPIKDIRTLVCFKPDDTIDTPSRSDGMTAFRDTCHRQTYFSYSGRRVQLHEETTFHGDYPPGVDESNARNRVVWGINLVGQPDIRSIKDVGWWYLDNRPGRVVEELADPALIAIRSSEDSTRWLGLIWEPASVLFCNPRNPCFHSDPVIADCPPGGTSGADGVLLFHQGTFEQLLDRALAWRDRIKSAKGVNQ